MLDAYEFAAFARDGHNGSYLTSYPDASPDDPNEVRKNLTKRFHLSYFHI